MEIEKALLRLIELQDEVTHYNEKGISYATNAYDSIRKRDILHREIIDYVRGLGKRTI